MFKEIKVGNRSVGEDCPCFIIAEAGSNHNQSLSMAKELIRAASDAGASAVKFQTIKFSEIYHEGSTDRKKKKFIKSLEIPEEWYSALMREAQKCGILFFSSPTYKKAVDFLFKSGVPAFKIGSSQAVSDLELIAQAAAKGLPLFIATGLIDFKRVESILDICRKEDNQQIVLLHCVALYPVPPDKASLLRMVQLRERFGAITGFSDHTLGINFALAAVSLGAKVIEKHFTISRKLKGPDHPFSLEPKELKEMVSEIRKIESGLPVVNTLSKEEKKIKDAVQLKWVAARDFSRGEKLDKDSLVARRLQGGIGVEEPLGGLYCARGIEKGEIINRNSVIKRK